jgi:hypothetical protein
MSTLMQSILVLTCAVALACPADAGEFYVSPKGDDAGDGRSPATAWKTTEKVNKSQFAAGDKILFERGGKWRGKTVCTRGNVVFSNRKNHLVFRNLVADETAGAVQGYGMRAEESIDVTFEDCEALRCGRHNFAAINAHQVTFRRCRSAYVAPKADNSLYVSYADGGAPVAKCDTLYEDCSSDHEDNGSGGEWGFFVSHGDHLGTTTFKNVIAHSKVSFMSAPVISSSTRQGETIRSRLKLLLSMQSPMFPN